MGPTGEMMLTYRATNALLTNSGCGVVLTVFCLPKSWEMPVKREFLCMLKKFLLGGFCSKVKIVTPELFGTTFLGFFLSQ